MRSMYVAFAITFLCGLLVACGGGSVPTSGNVSGIPTTPPSGAVGAIVLFSTNPDDNFLARITTADGTIATFLGNKASNGLAQSVTQEVVDDADGDSTKEVSITYNASGQPASEMTADGTTFQFNYVSATKLIIQATTVTDQTASVTYNPQTQQIAAGSMHTQSFSRTKSATVTGDITTTCNGLPAGAAVNAKFTPDQAPFIGDTLPIPVSYLSKGIYKYTIPANPYSSPSDVQSLSNALEPYVNGICTAVSGLNLTPTAIAAIVAQLSVVPGIGPELAAATAIALPALKYGCATATALVKAQSIANGIIATDIFAASGTITVTVVPPFPAQTQSYRYPGYGLTPPSLVFSLPASSCPTPTPSPTPTPTPQQVITLSPSSASIAVPVNCTDSCTGNYDINVTVPTDQIAAAETGPYRNGIDCSAQSNGNSYLHSSGETSSASPGSPAVGDYEYVYLGMPGFSQTCTLTVEDYASGATATFTVNFTP